MSRSLLMSKRRASICISKYCFQEMLLVELSYQCSASLGMVSFLVSSLFSLQLDYQTYYRSFTDIFSHATDVTHTLHNTVRLQALWVVKGDLSYLSRKRVSLSLLTARLLKLRRNCNLEVSVKFLKLIRMCQNFCRVSDPFLWSGLTQTTCFLCT